MDIYTLPCPACHVNYSYWGPQQNYSKMSKVILYRVQLSKIVSQDTYY